MLNFENFKTINILNILENNFKTKFDIKKNILLLNKFSYRNFNKKIKNKNLLYVVLDFRKIGFFGSILIIFLTFLKRKVYKNILIIYKFKKEATANNFIPDFWKKNNNILTDFFLWIKDFFRCLFYFKKINLILVRLR